MAGMSDIWKRQKQQVAQQEAGEPADLVDLVDMFQCEMCGQYKPLDTARSVRIEVFVPEGAPDLKEGRARWGAMKLHRAASVCPTCGDSPDFEGWQEIARHSLLLQYRQARAEGQRGQQGQQSKG
jgi:hypothetical protein